MDKRLWAVGPLAEAMPPSSKPRGPGPWQGKIRVYFPEISALVSICARREMRPRPCSEAPGARPAASRVYARPPSSQQFVAARLPAPPSTARSEERSKDGEGGAVPSSSDTDLARGLRQQRPAHDEPRRAVAAPRADGLGRASQVPPRHLRLPRRRVRAPGLLHKPPRAQPRVAKRSAPSEESSCAFRLATAGQEAGESVAQPQDPAPCG